MNEVGCVVVVAELFEIFGCVTGEKTAVLFDVMPDPVAVVGGGGGGVIDVERLRPVVDGALELVVAVEPDCPGRSGGKRPMGPWVEVEDAAAGGAAAPIGTAVASAAPRPPRPRRVASVRCFGVYRPPRCEPFPFDTYEPSFRTPQRDQCRGRLLALTYCQLFRDKATQVI